MSKESQYKFWRVPDLLDGLVQVMDMDSILEVSKGVPLVADLAGGTVLYKKLIAKATIEPLPRLLRHDTCRIFEEDQNELISRLQPLLTLVNRMSQPANAISILADHIILKFPSTDHQFKSIKVHNAGTNIESSISPLGFFLLFWVHRMAPTNSPIFTISEVNLTNLSSNLLDAVEKVIQDNLPSGRFSAHSITSESKLEAS